MVQRQAICAVIAVALIIVVAFAYVQLYKNSTAASNVAGPVVAPKAEMDDADDAQQQLDRLATSQDFVGSSACGECHADLLASYQKHPMYWGSTRLVSDDLNLPETSLSSIHGKKRVLSSETTGNSIVHHELMYDAEGNKIYDVAVKQKYVIGSGRRAKAYVHEQAGVLCLSPLNWFAKEQRWNLNPGYVPDDPRRFDRRANTICLQCHSGMLNVVEHGSEFLQQKQFEELPIGCEKCHGPGSGHIDFHKAREARSMDRSKISDTIVNPKKLDPFRQASVCYQCHLQPSTARILRPGRSNLDFRPGMRLDDVWIVTNTRDSVDSEGRTDSVRQVQQMLESACYQKASNMSCTSCHDPHQVPDDSRRIEFFRNRCVACHTDPNKCLGPRDARIAVSDSCIDCHMPKLDLASTAHVSQTDHRIVRSKASGSRGGSKIANESLFFFDETNELPELEKRRAKAIVNVKNGLVSNELVEELRFLRSHFPDDGFLALALGGISVTLKDYPTALESLQHAAACPQTEELALETLTQISYFAKDWSSAFKAFEMSLRLNPYRSQTLAIKADALLRTGQSEQSIEVAKEVLSYNPSLIEVHQWLSETYRKLGRTQEADAQNTIIQKMMNARPPTTE